MTNEATEVLTECTVKEMAARERVTERTVWHWIAKGAVEVRRTPGGGVRIVERRTHARGHGPAAGMKSSEI
jgi:predicted site-specific integrase-resolvase